MIDRCFVQKPESKLNFKLSQHWAIFCALQSRPLLRTPQLSMKEEYISLSLSPQKTTWYTFLNVIYVEFCNFKRCVCSALLCGWKTFFSRDEACCQYLSFMLQVPFDFIDFSKDFLEGKIDLEENSDKDEVCQHMRF